MPRTLINDLVNKWCGEVVFGTRFVQIAKVNVDSNSALFFLGQEQGWTPKWCTQWDK